jgi:hypothetical protein
MTDRLVSGLRAFAGECRESSPIYERLSLALAEDVELLAAIEPAVGVRFNSNLLFASARYLALSCGQEVPETPEGFRAFCLDRLDAIRELISTRVTQTNEVARCSYLLLGFEHARRERGRPLALLEVGASAGLNLLFDRYRYDYGAHGAVGPEGSPVVLAPRILAGVPPVPDGMPSVAWRLGIDIQPLDPTDPDDCLWLRALVWPEHQEREVRLERALAVAAESPVPILAGNAVELLPEAAAQAPAQATLVIFHTNTLPYLSPAERERLSEQIAMLGARRDTLRISGEGPPPAQDFETALRMASYTGAVGTERVLAHTLQHARGFAWLA